MASAAIMSDPSALMAESGRAMGLRELCSAASRIVSGVVVYEIPGTVVVGGGEPPVVASGCAMKVGMSSSMSGKLRVRVKVEFRMSFQSG